MLTAKKKIVKKEAGNENASPFSWQSIQAFFTDNAKIIGGVAAGVVILIVAIYFYNAGKEQDNIDASRELTKVQALYQQGQYKLAIAGDPSRGIPGLKEIASKYSGTPNGELASLYLGNAYLYTDDYTNAISTFESMSPDTDLLKAAVEAGIATAYYNKGDYKQAAEYFEKSAKTYENDFMSADRYLSAAEAYLQMGDKESAKTMLAEVKKAKTTKYQRDITRLTAQYDIEMD